MTPAQLAYDNAARVMHDTERRIASMTQWGRPSPDSVNGRILVSLEARRNREAAPLVELKIAAETSAPPRAATRIADDIRFKAREWQPAGSITFDDCIGDIPACLRRVRT
ncbi:MAG: hypothetical protein JWQ94_4277 [Tardiphaga sp.]|nr:hypothetical protein [Tardiphaga sp.]